MCVRRGIVRQRNDVDIWRTLHCRHCRRWTVVCVATIFLSAVLNSNLVEQLQFQSFFTDNQFHLYTFLVPLATVTTTIQIKGLF